MTRRPSPFPDETTVIDDLATVPIGTWEDITGQFSTIVAADEAQNWFQPAVEPEPVRQPQHRPIQKTAIHYPHASDALASTTLLSTVITDPVELETPIADSVAITPTDPGEVDNPHLYAALTAEYPVLDVKQRAKVLSAHGVSTRAAKEREEYWTELSRLVAAEPLEGPFWDLPAGAEETVELLFASKRKGAGDEVLSVAAAA